MNASTQESEHLPSIARATTPLHTMAAVQQAGPRRTAAAAAFRRPQCTHITVERAYGNLTCSMCGRVPNLGWVYRCRQDQLPAQDDILPDFNTVPAPQAQCDFYEATAKIADYLQISRSVVDGIRAHQYTPNQISKLIKQKQHLIQTINEVKSHVAEVQRPQQSPSDLIASVGTTTTATAEKSCQNPELAAALDKSNLKPVCKCPFQVCHTCRPFFHDRMYASFNAVLNGEAPQPSGDDPYQRPLINPLIALTIGLRKVPTSLQGSFRSNHSVDIASRSIDDNSDDISVDLTPTTTGAESDASSEYLDRSELYPCPGPGQCPVWSRYSGCAYDTGFDDGRRAINHGYLATQFSNRLTPENSRSHLYHLFGNVTDTPGGASSTASSISLPTPSTSMLASLLPTDDTFDIALQKQLNKVPKVKSSCSERSSQRTHVPLRRQQSNSSFGSEIEVHGGVALTEEAIRNSTPDILTMS